MIDLTELNRVIAYWREGAYHRDPAGEDGYAPGVGDQTGPRHTADYDGTPWQINSSELNRVLSFWRAGGYRADPAGLDGYTPIFEP